MVAGVKLIPSKSGFELNGENQALKRYSYSIQKNDLTTSRAGHARIACLATGATRPAATGTSKASAFGIFGV
jgi:hypothetical protein